MDCTLSGYIQKQPMDYPEAPPRLRNYSWKVVFRSFLPLPVPVVESYTTNELLPFLLDSTPLQATHIVQQGRIVGTVHKLYFHYLSVNRKVITPWQFQLSS